MALPLTLALLTMTAANTPPPWSLDALADLTALPVLRHGCRLHVARPPAKGRSVLLDQKGPGVIVRMWFSRPDGTLTIVRDGVATSTRLDAMRRPPLAVRGTNGAITSYTPRPFQKACRVTLTGGDPAKTDYAIAVLHLPPDTVIPPTPHDYDARLDRVLAAWRKGPTGLSLGTHARPCVGRILLRPGARHAMVTRTGPGMITRVTVRCRPWNRALDRMLEVRARWDGASGRAVAAPIGDLCGNVFLWDNDRSLTARTRVQTKKSGAVTVKTGQYVFALPMPFATSACLELVNRSTGLCPEVRFEVVVAACLAPETMGRFMGRFMRLKQAAPGPDRGRLRLDGPGHLVGLKLDVQGFGAVPGEAQVRLHVDGRRTPDLAGLAVLPRLAGNVWGRNWESPLVWLQPANWWRSRLRAGAVRTFLADAVPFEKRLAIALDMPLCGGSAPDYAMTALWYSAAEHPSVPVPSRADLLRSPFRMHGGMEPEDVAAAALTDGGVVSVLDDVEDRLGLSQGRALVFYADRPFQSLTLPVRAPARDMYRVEFRTLAGGGSSGAFRAISRARVVSQVSLYQEDSHWHRPWADGYWAPIPPTPLYLEQGWNPLSFESLGPRGRLVLDHIRLDRNTAPVVAIEPELTAPVSVDGGRAEPNPLGDMDRSHWGSLVFRPTGGPKAEMTFAVRTVQGGDLHLYGNAVGRPDGSAFRILFDGQPLGDVFDTRRGPKAETPPVFSVVLPDVTPGGHRVTFALTNPSPDRVLELDVFALAPAGVYEIDLLARRPDPCLPLRVQSYPPRKDSPDSANNVVTIQGFPPDRTGLAIYVHVPEEGDYRVTLHAVAKAPFRLTIAGQTLPIPKGVKPLTLDRVHLGRGPGCIRLDAATKRRAAHVALLDALILTRCSSP